MPLFESPDSLPHPRSISSLSLYIYIYISIHLFAHLLFRGGTHLPRRAGAPHPARHAGDHDATCPCDRDPGIQSHRFYMFTLPPIMLAARGSDVSGALVRKPEVTRLWRDEVGVGFRLGGSTCAGGRLLVHPPPPGPPRLPLSHPCSVVFCLVSWCYRLLLICIC